MTCRLYWADDLHRPGGLRGSWGTWASNDSSFVKSWDNFIFWTVGCVKCKMKVPGLQIHNLRPICQQKNTYNFVWKCFLENLSALPNSDKFYMKKSFLVLCIMIKNSNCVKYCVHTHYILSYRFVKVQNQQLLQN